MTATNSVAAEALGPVRELESEVRFGVVMYGGVSLAVYINGVTEELFNLVRSTAPAKPVSEVSTVVLPALDALTETDHIYRKVAYLIADQKLLARYRDYLNNPSGLPDPLTTHARANATLKMRFLIDVVSGTSAGGLNGLYLGKALANDQSLEALSQLWMKAADIKDLINDKQSISGLSELETQDPPRSLLNSERMFLKLLEGFDAMSASRPTKDDVRRSPYIDELDVFATTTDITGRLVPFKVSETIVNERRHRSVFRLQYRATTERLPARNDFADSSNPFLAFVGRCTSSFPFAFDPMQYGDLTRLMKDQPLGQKNDHRDLDRNWQELFGKTFGPSHPEVDDKGNLKEQETLRAFGDGGFLDNKPFSFAIDAIASRDPLVPAARKLIYVEPDPERSDNRQSKSQRPNALDTAFAAAVGLPMYETIREDLERVLRRNRRIERVQWISAEIRKDLAEARQIIKARPAPEASIKGQLSAHLSSEKEAQPDYQNVQKKDWGQWTILDMAEYHGPYYLPYRRLRVASVTDDIVNWVGKAANLSGDQLLGVRALVRAWRDESFADYVDLKSRTLNAFLSAFDIRYRIRRARFISERVDQLLRWVRFYAEPSAGGQRYSFPSGDDATLIHRVVAGLRNESNRAGALPNGVDATVAEQLLLFLRHRFRFMAFELRSDLRALDEGLEIRGNRLEFTDLAKFREQSKELVHQPDLLRKLIDVGSSANAELEEAACLGRSISEASVNLVRKNAHVELDQGTRKADLKMLFENLERFIEKILVPHSKEWPGLLNADTLLPVTLPDQVLSAQTLLLCQSMRRCLDEDLRGFDDFDQITFPLLQDTDAVEDGVVDVIRISPDDAPLLVNQSDGKKKLAGIKLFHFGAFLSEKWRMNDRMWGRLDGAERLISALLPGNENGKVRETLVREAHELILRKELWTDNFRDVGRALSESLIRMRAGPAVPDSAVKVDPATQQIVNKLIENLNPGALYDFFKAGHQAPPAIPAKESLPLTGRAVRVLGDMLRGIAVEKKVDQKYVSWIAASGSMLSLMVGLAMPGGLPSGFFKRLIAVAYGFELFLIATGLVTANSNIARYGGLLLGITLGIDFCVMLIRRVLKVQSIKTDLFAVVAVIALILAAAGMDSLFSTEIVANLKKLGTRIF